MKTDHQITGKFYKKLDAFTKGNGSQQMPRFDTWYYFGSSEQFKTCKNFVSFLKQKHQGHEFIAHVDRG